MVRLCSYFAHNPLGSCCLSSPYTGPQRRSSLRVSCTSSALQFLPASSSLLPLGLHDHSLIPLASVGTVTTLSSPWHLWQGSVSPGPWCRAAQRTFTEPWTGSCYVQPSIPPSSHGWREDWLMSGHVPVWEREGWAENTIRVSTPADDPSLPRSQARARWLLAPAGMAVPCTQWALTLPELSLPRALPWQEAMLKKI